jgi:hypothetical protein
MISTYEPQSEHEYELLGSIKGIGDRAVAYYNHTTMRIEIYIEKFEEIIKLVLSLEEARELVELLKQAIIRSNSNEGSDLEQS